MIASAAVALLVAGAMAVQPTQAGCLALLVPQQRAAVAAVLLRDLDVRSSLCVVLQRMGAPARDIGSGLHVLQWDIDDGRTLTVSTDGDPVNPLFAFQLRPAPRSSLH